MFLGAKGEDIKYYIRIIQAIFKQEKGVYKTKTDKEEEQVLLLSMNLKDDAAVWLYKQLEEV